MKLSKKSGSSFLLLFQIDIETLKYKSSFYLFLHTINIDTQTRTINPNKCLRSLLVSFYWTFKRNLPFFLHVNTETLKLKIHCFAYWYSEKENHSFTFFHINTKTLNWNSIRPKRRCPFSRCYPYCHRNK